MVDSSLVPPVNLRLIWLMKIELVDRSDGFGAPASSDVEVMVQRTKGRIRRLAERGGSDLHLTVPVWWDRTGKNWPNKANAKSSRGT
jgi:hypothetical protein